MPLESTIAFGLSIIAFATLAIVVIRSRTVLFGFTVFSFLHIASAGLSGFLFNTIFRLNDAWITDAHIYVFTYTGLGLTVYSLGAFLAWRPLNQIQDDFFEHVKDLPWVNPRFVFLCIFIGAVAYQFAPIAYRIPTVRAVWSTFFEFLNIGVLIALIYGKSTRHYQPFVYSMIAFAVLVLFQAVLSGHIGAGGMFMLQLLVVSCFWKSFSLRSTFIFVAGLALIMSVMVGWLDSRDVIRSGSLNELGVLDRSTRFLEEFEYINPTDLNVNRIQEKIHLRVDMTSILAAQVRYQPYYQPYAYGGTILSNLLAALVPRFLWSNKPVQLGGSEFVSRYTGLLWPPGTSVGLAYQFELYANGGIVGVLAGLFFLGWLTAKLELSLFTSSFKLPQFLVMVILTSLVTTGSQTIVALIMGIVAGCIGVYALGRMLENVNAIWHFWQTKELEPKTTSTSKQSSIPRVALGNKS